MGEQIAAHNFWSLPSKNARAYKGVSEPHVVNQATVLSPFKRLRALVKVISFPNESGLQLGA